ncbi:MAG: alpha/beta hydrolase, partial [Synergistaceae bacterium]|nr:alpha/beta hydrolase [Synergistaceae bacterium]
DLPGFGGSDEPPAGWSVGDYADFVASFLESLGISEAAMIGHSFGGRVIIKLASGTWRVKVTKAVLTGGAGIRSRATLRGKLRSCLYRAVRRVISVEAVKKKFPLLLERWRMKNGSADYRNATPRMRECLVKVVNEDLTRHLPDIKCPTLLIWGDQDTETPLADAKTMERLIPDAGLVVLKNAGHYPFIDQGYAFGRVLDSFLCIRRHS